METQPKKSISSSSWVGGLLNVWSILSTRSLACPISAGPVLVIQIPAGDNITASVLSQLDIPDDAEKVIFKTDNTLKYEFSHFCQHHKVSHIALFF